MAGLLEINNRLSTREYVQDTSARLAFCTLLLLIKTPLKLLICYWQFGSVCLSVRVASCLSFAVFLLVLFTLAIYSYIKRL